MRKINSEKTNEKYKEFINNNPIVGQQIIDDEAEKILAKYDEYDTMTPEDTMAVFCGVQNIVWEDVPDNE